MIVDGGKRRSAADFGEFQVGFAGDDVVGEADDFLALGFVADFGAAEDDDQIGAQTLEQGDDLRRRRHVPNVDAEADDARIVRKDGLDDFQRALVDVELGQRRPRLKVAQIRHEIAQPKRRMQIAGVERG